MTLNIILAVSLYPVLLIVYFVERKLCRKSGGYHFGVRLEDAWLVKDEFKEIEKKYCRQMNWLLLLSTVTGVIPFFATKMSYQYSIWMAWFILFIFAYEVPYVKAFNKLKNYKKLWKLEEKKEELTNVEEAGLRENNRTANKDANSHMIYVDTGIISQSRRLKWYSFLPQLILNAIIICAAYLMPILDVTRAILWVHGGSIIAFLVIALLIDCARGEIVSEDTQVNLNFNRAKKRIWSRIWNWSIWLFTGLNMTIFFTAAYEKNVYAVILWGVILVCLIMIVFLGKGMKQLDQVNRKYRSQANEEYIQDDDDMWIWGMVYYNPKDKRNMVEHRVGTGWSMNMAKPAGKILLTIGLVALLVVPVSSVWMIVDENTPKLVTYEEGSIICKDQKVRYSISVDEIEEISYVALPEERSKYAGSNYDYFERGTYEVYHMGKFKEYVYTDLEKVICLKTADDTYYISCPTEEETKHLFEVLEADCN